VRPTVNRGKCVETRLPVKVCIYPRVQYSRLVFFSLTSEHALVITFRASVYNSAEAKITVRRSTHARTQSTT
jgi:hypothetical protein